MSRVRLICWNPELARERGKAIEAEGWPVDASPLETKGLIAQFREQPPQVVVIDLDRLPSHGREVAVALRTSKSTATLPVVLAGGPAEKVERIRRELPDAVFTTWQSIGPAIRNALASPPTAPVRPLSHMERYAGRDLATKLGLKDGMPVALIAPPEGFAERFAGLAWQSRLSARSALVLWFVRSSRELEAAMEQLAVRLPEGVSAWVVYPKKSGRIKVDFSENDVRTVGIAQGLVDYKVCAVDADWTGLKFARKRA